MAKLTVTVTQWDPTPDRLEAQWTTLQTHLTNNQTDFLLLPEMPFSPWLCAQEAVDTGAWGLAAAAHEEKMEDLDRLGADTILLTQPLVAEDGRRLNRAVAWNQGALIDIHDKYYLPREPGFWEADWYDRGDGHFTPVRLGQALVGVQICTEMWFQAEARTYMKAGIDLLCVPRATGPGSLDKWLAGGRAAAVVSGAYCLSANLYLPEAEQEPEDLGGLGWIIDPDGEVLATTSPDTPFATATLDLAAAKAAKSSYPRYVRE